MMTEDQKSAFVAALAELAALKPGAKLAKESYAAWWNIMRENWSLESFQGACIQLARDVEFMPNPYHFEQLRKSARLTAGEAWTKVLAVARSNGRTSGDPLIDKAVFALGGYRAIGMSETDKTHFLEKRFSEHYADIDVAIEIREALAELVSDAPNNIRTLGARKALR
jgi:hypothetical protein